MTPRSRQSRTQIEAAPDPLCTCEQAPETDEQFRAAADVLSIRDFTFTHEINIYTKPIEGPSKRSITATHTQKQRILCGNDLNSSKTADSLFLCIC